MLDLRGIASIGEDWKSCSERGGYNLRRVGIAEA